MNINEKIDKSWSELKKDPLAVQVFSSNRPRMLSSADERFIYYSAFDNADISMINSEGTVLLAPVEEFLEASGWYKHRKHEYYVMSEVRSSDTFQIWLHDGGYMISCNISKANKKGKKYLSGIDAYVSAEPTAVAQNSDAPSVIDSFELFYPAAQTNDPETQKYLSGIIDVFRANYYKESRASKIGIISHDGSDYYVKNFSLDGKVPAFVHVDEHYGEGFNDFHDKMIERIKEESKGLILFHGDPGT